VSGFWHRTVWQFGHKVSKQIPPKKLHLLRRTQHRFIVSAA
jgi:hypothetical protein